MTDNLPVPEKPNWKMQTYIVGGLTGLALGLLSAYFFARVSEENELNGPSRISTIDTLKLAVAVLAIMRQITDLGASGKNKK